MSMMICGRFETLSPRNAAIATVVSSPARSYAVWPTAGAAPSRSSSAAAPDLRMHLLDAGLRRLRDDSGNRGRQSADHLGVKLCAREPPQLLQGFSGRSRA